MEQFAANSSKEVPLEPFDHDDRAHNRENMSGIEPSKFTNGRPNWNRELHDDEGVEGSEISSHIEEELEPESIDAGPEFVMDAGLENLKRCPVDCRYEKLGHHEVVRYGTDELLGLWEVSVNYETSWNHVVTALSPLMGDMYEMQAMPDIKYRRRRSKNSERRQRFKARREAMLSILQNKQDPGECKNEDCDDSTDSNIKASDEYHFVGIQKGPLKARHRGRQYHSNNDEYVESFQPQAFAVDGEPDFESGDPQDGWEYLRRVIWEAARCPKVVVANIDPGKLASEQTPYMPMIPAIPSCPPELLPSKDWESCYLADFTQLRKELSRLCAPAESSSDRLPSVWDKAAWEILCFGAVTSTQAEDLEESVPFAEMCGVSPGHEERDGATVNEFIQLHPLTGTSNIEVRRERVGMGKASDSPLSELEGHSTRDDTENDDAIQLGAQEGTAAEHLRPTEPPRPDVLSASGGIEAAETHKSRPQDLTEDHSVNYEHKGSLELIADLMMTKTAQGSDISDPSECYHEENVDKVMLRYGNMASCDVEGVMVPLPETIRLQMKLEEEVSAEDGDDISTVTGLTNSCVHTSNVTQQLNHHAAATELINTFHQWPETTRLQMKLEEEVSAKDGDDISTVTGGTNSCVHTSNVTEQLNHHAAATELINTFDQWPELSGLRDGSFTPEHTSDSRDLQCDLVDPSRGACVTYEYPAEAYEYPAEAYEYPAEAYGYAADFHQVPEFEDDDIQTGDLNESLGEFDVYNSKNLLADSEDEGRESISEIEMSVQQLFTKVFRVEKAWDIPLIHTLLRLDVVSRATLFRHHVSWLESVENLPQERALWLLGLAAVVDTPLSGDSTAAFRAMLRYCAGVRASKKALSDEELHMLNALITVAGLYFGQAEADLI